MDTSLVEWMPFEVRVPGTHTLSGAGAGQKFNIVISIVLVSLPGLYMTTGSSEVFPGLWHDWKAFCTRKMSFGPGI